MNDDLLLEFFLTFARTEYALKATSLFKHRAVEENVVVQAEPDWNAFADVVRDVFDRSATPELAYASQYLIDHPPKRQVIINGALAWEPAVRGHNESETDFVLRMARSVRNNLFHGGKYNGGIDHDQERNEKLVRASLTVIRGCLAVAADQQVAFLDAEL